MEYVTTFFLFFFLFSRSSFSVTPLRNRTGLTNPSVSRGETTLIPSRRCRKSGLAYVFLVVSPRGPQERGIRANLGKIEGTIISGEGTRRERGRERERERGVERKIEKETEKREGRRKFTGYRAPRERERREGRSAHAHTRAYTRHVHRPTHARLSPYSLSAFILIPRDTEWIRVSEASARIAFPAITRDPYRGCSKLPSIYSAAFESTERYNRCFIHTYTRTHTHTQCM